MKSKSFSISIISIVLISFQVYAQIPDTVWVDDDYNATTAGWGTTHFAVIQEGVDAVAKAGTVNVAAGTWNENIEINGGKSLIGSGIGQSIINGDGTTYTISVTEHEVIETESFIQNFTLNNSSENWGNFEINMDPAYNLTVQNNHILKNGIMLATSQNCIISNNLIEGIGNLYISQSWNSRIENNLLTNGVLFVVDNSCNNIISNNSILDGNCNCIRVGRSSNNLFKNNTVHGARQNFLFTASNDNIIVGNNISGHWDNPVPPSAGIVVFRGNNNTIINNNIDDVLDGGITLFGASNNNVIQSNSITNSTRGIDIYYDSNNNRVINNTVQNNSAGIILDNTSGNVVYDNNLVNNQMNGYDDGTNVWDSGARGNYWTDYEGEDQNGDGVGDTPKLIPTAGNDHFPATQIIPVTLATEPSLQLATYKLMDESYVYITDEQTISNEHGELSETFIVQNGGTLILDNVDWEVPYDYLGELIIVESGGNLRITNSKIVSQGGNIKAREGATLHIENSEFVGLGMTDGEGSIYITCDNAVIKDNVIKNAFSGIGIDAGSGHQIINNRISETFVGISINDIITDTRFEGNTIYNSIRSAILGFLNNSTIINNTFRDIWKETLFITATQQGSNLIYKNNFFNCSFSRTSGADSWYLNNQGNYYSDYLDKFPNAQEHASFSGIWDNPYIHYPCNYIDESYFDNYPLMYPVYFDTVVTPPEQPILLSPPPNAVNIPTETEFGWNPSVAATSYRLQISDYANFETPIFNQGSITEPVKIVNILNESTLYYWRVLAENLGVISDWSDAWSFTTPSAELAAPLLSLPIDNASDQPLELSLSWQSVEGATEYHLQVDEAFDFSSPVCDEDSISNTEFTLTAPGNSTKFYWRVRALNEDTNSEWSAVWSFTTLSKELLAPVLSLPSDGATEQPLNLTIYWQTVNDAESYHLQFDSDPEFETPLVDLSNISTTSFDLSDLEHNSLYYWRIMAELGDISSPWSEVWSFGTIRIVGIYNQDDRPLEFKIFPNPVGSGLNIAISNNYIGEIQVQIVGVNGRTVFEQEYFLTGSDEHISLNLDTDKFYQGIYILKIIRDTEIITWKIAIQ